MEESSTGRNNDFSAEAMAALSLVEGLMIALLEAEILSKEDISEVLESAAAAHENATSLSHETRTLADPGPPRKERAQKHQDAARIIRHLLSGGNSLRLNDR